MPQTREYFARVSLERLLYTHTIEYIHLITSLSLGAGFAMLKRLDMDFDQQIHNAAIEYAAVSGCSVEWIEQALQLVLDAYSVSPDETPQDLPSPEQLAKKTSKTPYYHKHRAKWWK